MQRKPSSQKKPSKKAGSPNRPISSSTTAPAPPPDERTSEDSGPHLFTDAPEPLTRRQQRAFEKLLMLGASPAAACQKLGLTLDAVAITLDADHEFETCCRRIHDALGENVKAALYKAAMNGTTAAQALWFRLAAAIEADKARHAHGTANLTGDELRRRIQREVALFRRRSGEASDAAE
jgi:hypothetical protein